MTSKTAKDHPSSIVDRPSSNLLPFNPLPTHRTEPPPALQLVEPAIPAGESLSRTIARIPADPPPSIVGGKRRLWAKDHFRRADDVHLQVRRACNPLQDRPQGLVLRQRVQRQIAGNAP